MAATLTITNKTKLNLKDDKTFVTSGHVKVPAREILPNHCEAMAMHKYSGTATGSYGVTSFAIGEEGDKVVILWGCSLQSEPWEKLARACHSAWKYGDRRGHFQPDVEPTVSLQCFEGFLL